MLDKKIRKIIIDDDTIEVEYVFDKEKNRWFGEFPIFEEKPKYTPNNRPWKNVFELGCEYSDSKFGDCGGCSYFHREQPLDVIAVCFHEKMKKSY